MSASSAKSRPYAVDYKYEADPVGELIYWGHTLPYQPALGYSQTCGNAKAFSAHQGITEARVLVHRGDYLWHVVTVYRDGEKVEDRSHEWQVSGVM